MQDVPTLGESGSEVSHLIPEPRNFAKVTKLSKDKKTLDKGNSKGYKTSNRQSDFSSSWDREGWAYDSMHGCLQK